MPAKLTQEFVDAWLAENRPDFVPEPGWVYVNADAPIPGSCQVCGAECAPVWYNMKRGSGHCAACGHRAAGETNRAHGEAEAQRVAAERGYEVLRFFTKRHKHSGRASGFQNTTLVTLRCLCGNVWDVQYGNFLYRGSGCPPCATSGFDSGKPADLYLLTRNKRGLQETQYGISNRLEGRLAEHARHGWRLVDVISGDGTEILALENLIKDAMKAEGVYRREYKDEKYDGYTEAWDASDGLRPFMSLEFLLSWADARVGLREEVAA